MKKVVNNHVLDEKNVREIVRDEIEKTKPRWAYKMENDLVEKMENLELATRKEIYDFKDQILDAVDGVMGEVKAMREEQTLIGERLSLHSDTLENHETRIGKLEKTSFAKAI